MFIRSVQRDNKIKKLIQNGQQLQGVLVNINSSGSGSGSSYRIEVSAVDSSGAVQNYLSDPLTGIGGLAMMDFRNTPIPIDVFVDPLDHRNCYVDVADIPNLTPERIMELLKSVVMKKPVNTFANSESSSASNFTKPPEPQL